MSLQITEIYVAECSTKALYCCSCADKYFFACDSHFTSFPIWKLTLGQFVFTLCPKCYQALQQQFTSDVKTELLERLGEGLRDAHGHLADYIAKDYQNHELVLWSQRAVINALKRLQE